MAEQPPPGETPQQPATQTPAPDVVAPTPAAAAAADNAPMSNEAVDDLLKQAKGIEGVQAAASPAPEAVAAPAPAAADAGAMSQESIDELLKQANFDSPDAGDAHGKGPSVEQLLQQANIDEAAVAGELPGADAEALKLPNFQQVMADAQVSSIDLLRDVELNVKIELGRSRMLVDEVLKLSEGSVVELDKLAGDPVDVFVNDRLVARGEVLVLNDSFCVRVNEIVPAAKEEGM
jgi:flagellar motor switch protein FliN/FliY